MNYPFLLLLFLSSLNASSAYNAGKSLYMQKGCFSCHGNKLEGLHKYPYLANRAKNYMSYKLKRFRSKISDNQQQEMMIPFAIGLSDKDIDDLTTYMYEFVEEKNKDKYDDSYQVSGDGGS
ncbi:MAG: cytochrome C [Sulfurimonas sp. RIFOXYD12_FULL_33_39]|uniref:c-type cytochrome n=1 Tax=unclassified Sulfurimonas TaxID=2623549 RepID=UPI0008B07D35|nr:MULTISPECIES: c-type cytochrome [unclassified Sulfurimonas]OHE07387.1 MAG: cytochrome C [Sulfurimonas sp. RIFCSPLOWO2_12_FULL_34_6]OHE08842.1 MAG: cytochrome C [Sulfurimonas sp. RIFOXYD12_FULL_33_39]OHE14152.1 MAG: cytochrome C [Sulfurimonas sp. RIFOXYD2_FULL_34_21]DAB28025.1 MAG TPA: cytochrome C [Sulfurimonas sp. UBA10385]